MIATKRIVPQGLNGSKNWADLFSTEFSSDEDGNIQDDDVTFLSDATIGDGNIFRTDFRVLT